MADGHIQFIKSSISMATWWSLGTRANGEVISSDSTDLHRRLFRVTLLLLSRSTIRRLVVLAVLAAAIAFGSAKGVDAWWYRD